MVDSLESLATANVSIMRSGRLLAMVCSSKSKSELILQSSKNVVEIKKKNQMMLESLLIDPVSLQPVKA